MHWMNGFGWMDGRIQSCNLHGKQPDVCVCVCVYCCCFATELLRVSECWYNSLITCTRTQHMAPRGDSQVSRRRARSGKPDNRPDKQRPSPENPRRSSVARTTKRMSARVASHLGWHYLSNTTCLIRSHSFYASFVVSRITISCRTIRRFWRKRVVDKQC